MRYKSRICSENDFFRSSKDMQRAANDSCKTGLEQKFHRKTSSQQKFHRKTDFQQNFHRRSKLGKNFTFLSIFCIFKNFWFFDARPKIFWSAKNIWFPSGLGTVSSEWPMTLSKMSDPLIPIPNLFQGSIFNPKTLQQNHERHPNRLF